MRVSRLVLFLVLLCEFNFCLDSVSGSMVTIPASVAFAIITGAVKMKLILVKVIFALRTMGKKTIHYRASSANKSIFHI
jgi:hypothetical protein